MSSSKKPTTSNSAVIPALFDGNHAHGRDAEQAVIPNHVVAVRLAAVVFDSVDAGMAAALGDEVWHEVLRRDDLVGVGEWKPKVLQEVVGPAAHAGKVDEADSRLPSISATWASSPEPCFPISCIAPCSVSEK